MSRRVGRSRPRLVLKRQARTGGIRHCGECNGVGVHPVRIRLVGVWERHQGQRSVHPSRVPRQPGEQRAVEWDLLEGVRSAQVGPASTSSRLIPHESFPRAISDEPFPTRPIPPPRIAPHNSRVIAHRAASSWAPRRRCSTPGSSRSTGPTRILSSSTRSSRSCRRSAPTRTTLRCTPTALPTGPLSPTQ